MKLDEARDALLAWSRTNKFKKRIEKSTKIIEQTLKLCKSPYVAFSAGKDSSVMAHIALQMCKSLPLRIVTAAESRIMFRNLDVVLEWFKSQGATVDEVLIDRVFSKEWKSSTWEEQRKASKHDLRAANDGTRDCVFLGLRMQESNRRRMTLLSCKTEGYPSYSYRMKQGFIRCCPVAEWSENDIGAYLVANEIPVLDWYEKFGIESRTSMRITEHGIALGFMPQLRTKDPSAFNLLAKRFPEFKALV